MRKRDAERTLRCRAEETPDGATLWIDANWIAALGNERIQEIVSEYGFGPLRGHGTGEPIAPSPTTGTATFSE